MKFHLQHIDELVSLVPVSAGRPLDDFTPHAHPARRGGRGRAGKANPGGGRGGRGPEPPEGGRDVQHGGRQVEEEERPARGLDGSVHRRERYGHEDTQETRVNPGCTSCLIAPVY